jgi:hypothetical protein
MVMVVVVLVQSLAQAALPLAALGIMAAEVQVATWLETMGAQTLVAVAQAVATVAVIGMVAVAVRAL